VKNAVTKANRMFEACGEDISKFGTVNLLNYKQCTAGKRPSTDHRRFFENFKKTPIPDHVRVFLHDYTPEIILRLEKRGIFVGQQPTTAVLNCTQLPAAAKMSPIIVQPQYFPAPTKQLTSFVKHSLVEVMPTKQLSNANIPTQPSKDPEKFLLPQHPPANFQESSQEDHSLDDQFQPASLMPSGVSVSCNVQLETGDVPVEQELCTMQKYFATVGAVLGLSTSDVTVMIKLWVHLKPIPSYNLKTDGRTVMRAKTELSKNKFKPRILLAGHQPPPTASSIRSLQPPTTSNGSSMDNEEQAMTGRNKKNIT
jgi:hypothetical protein